MKNLTSKYAFLHYNEFSQKFFVGKYIRNVFVNDIENFLFQTKDGDEVLIMRSGLLAYLLEEGKIYGIKYIGKRKKNKREYNNFVVFELENFDEAEKL